MIRLVLGIVLAAALLAASLPAAADARAERSDARVDAAVDRLRIAARSLLGSDAAVVGRGARRVVTVELPTGSLASAPVERFAVACPRRCVVAYRLAGSRRRVPLGDLPLSTPDGPVVFGTPGPHRVVLGLVPDRATGAPTVTVRAG